MTFSLTALLKYFVFDYYIYPSLSLLFLSSYIPFCFVHTDVNPVWYRTKMPTDQNKNKRQYRSEITTVLPIVGQNFPRYFECYLESFAPFRNFCVFISLLISEPLVVFCGTLSWSFRWRHRVLCMVGTEFLNKLLMKLLLQMLIESSTG